MKIEEIKGLSTKELVDTYKETRVKLAKMRFQSVISALEEPHLVSVTKKTIARLLGEMNRRRIESEMAAFEKKINVDG